MPRRVGRAVLTALLLCTGPWAAARAAEAPVADTPASDTAKRLFAISAADQDDATSLQAVQQLYIGPNLTPQTWPFQHALWKRLRYHGVERASATEAELTAFDPDDEVWTHIVFTVELAAPHRVTRLAISPGPRPADVAPPPKLQPRALAEALRTRVSAMAKADKFAGTVLVAHGGRAVLTQAYGLADREAGVRDAPDTQYRFGSMGKMFTAVAIMQLAQAGKLDLGAPIGTYLNDYPNQDIAQHVTIGHLLSHSGGTGDIFGPQSTAHRQELRDPRDYVALYGARDPLFAAGSQQAYSNYGFMLLGRIVETVSGLPYDDYIERSIFAPAGMTSTGNAPENVRLPKRSVSYTGPPGQTGSAADTLPYRGTPAGGGYSTVGDMLRFATALTSGKLMDAAHYSLLTTGGVDGPNGRLLHYDFGSQTPEGRRFFGHNGGAPGMSGDLRIFPDRDWFVVVLSNRDPPVASAVANFITDRLP